MQAMILPPTTKQYTQHAAHRCLERDINPAIVEQIIEHGELMRDCPDGVQVFGIRRVRVVFDPCRDTVITVYRVPKRNPKRCVQRQRQSQRVQQRANRFYPCF